MAGNTTPAFRSVAPNGTTPKGTVRLQMVVFLAVADADRQIVFTRDQVKQAMEIIKEQLSGGALSASRRLSEKTNGSDGTPENTDVKSSSVLATAASWPNIKMTWQITEGELED